jgi:hypothetical protein
MQQDITFIGKFMPTFQHDSVRNATKVHPSHSPRHQSLSGRARVMA